MKILLVFSLFLVSVGGGESRTVRGYPGGGVLIRCRYEQSYTSNPKYFCIAPWPCLTKPVWTGVKNEWSTTGRFSLLDNTSSAEFWVMIRDLTVQDSGTYKCAVDIDRQLDVYTPVKLIVKEDPPYEKSISVIGHVGGGVNISCTYPQSLSRDPKFLCRRVNTPDCNYTTSVNESGRWRNEGRLSLHDDGKQTFTVSINNPTVGDSGEYWCGAESDWTSDDGYRVYITQVNLSVTDTVPQPSTHISSETTTPTTSPAPETTPASATDSPPPGFPDSSVFLGIVSGILVLILIGLVFFTLTSRKRSKTQASVQSQPDRNPSYDYTFSPPVSVYEEIKDTRHHPTSDDGASTVYAAVHSPTDDSEASQAVYGNVQTPSSGGFPQAVYSTAQLPSNPPDQDTYSTAQLPTIPSDSSAPAAEGSDGEPEEGLTYATVKLSKKAGGSTNSVPGAAFSKEKDPSEGY